MKKIIFLVLILLSIPYFTFGQEKKKAIYFYSTTCAHCKNVDDFFTKNKIYEECDIKKIETSGPYNIDQLNKLFDAFGVIPEKRGSPVIFFEDRMLIGDKPIINNFVKEIESVEAKEYPTEELIKIALVQKNKEESSKTRVTVSWPVLIGAALVDAINPCAFAVLILLIATVIAAKGKKEALYSGLAFSATIFVSYLLMGLGIYKAVGAFNLPQIFSIIIGSIAILIGLANLKDVFWYGKVFIMEVPLSWRPKMQSILKKVTSPLGAVGAGLLVSLFLLPCTSGPYVVVLGLLAEKENFGKAFPMLILYNFIFILPMLAITIGMYFGVRMKKLEELRRKNLRLLHAIAGVIMLFIGVYLISSWL